MWYICINLERKIWCHIGTFQLSHAKGLYVVHSLYNIDNMLYVHTKYGRLVHGLYIRTYNIGDIFTNGRLYVHQLQTYPPYCVQYIINCTMLSTHTHTVCVVFCLLSILIYTATQSRIITLSIIQPDWPNQYKISV